jgi:hypothetical protein
VLYNEGDLATHWFLLHEGGSVQVGDLPQKNRSKPSKAVKAFESLRRFCQQCFLAAFSVRPYRLPKQSI